MSRVSAAGAASPSRRVRIARWAPASPVRRVAAAIGIAWLAVAAVTDPRWARAATPEAAPPSASTPSAAPPGSTTADGASPNASTPATAPQGDATRGIALYDEHCAGCHGPTGQGDGPLVDRLPAPPPSLAARGVMARLSAADIWTTVTNGRLDRGMPPFSRLLTDRERWDVVAFVRAFGDQHPLLLAAADDAWADGCASCHGDADAFAARLAAPPAGTDAPPGADSLVVRSPAAMFTRYTLVDAHDESAFHSRALDAALAGLRRHGSVPLPLPGAAPGGRIAGRVVAPAGATTRASFAATVTLRASALGLGIDLGAVDDAADGAFAFDGLVVGDGIEYEPEAFFDGVRYRPTEVVTLTAGSPNRTDVVLNVYPADPKAPVRIAALSGLAKADAERGEVAVFEIWQVANDGQVTRVSADGAPTFRLPLPIGARDVVLEDRTGRDEVASRRDASGEGFVASRLPVPPGGREIVASYAMPYRGTTATLERTLVDGVDQLGWVVADAGAVAVSPQLTGPTPDRFGDQPVSRYVGRAVPSGERWTIRLNGLPPAAAAPGSPQDVLGPAPMPLVRQDVVRDGALGGAVAALLAALLASEAMRRERRRGTTSDRRTARGYRGVIEAIARLDERFDRGEIAPNAHRRRRGALVARALALREAAGLDAGAASDGADHASEG